MKLSKAPVIGVLLSFVIAFICSLPALAGIYMVDAGSVGSTINVSTCVGCRVVNVRTIPGVTVDDGVSDSSAINTYLQNNKTDVIYFFPRGVYNSGAMLNVTGLTNVAFVGEKGAIIRKNSGHSGEYIWYFHHGSNISVSGLRFEGLTVSTTTYTWGEQGVYFGSCRNVRFYNNEVVNFGDAGFRASTFPTDTIDTVQSFNVWVENNYFSNVSQVTTTPNDTIVNGKGRAGTDNFFFRNNILDNVKSSVKVCGRSKTTNSVISNNIINVSPAVATGVGIEGCSVSDVIIDGNIITGAQNYAINFYTNDQMSSFPWGTVHITNNIVRDCFRGIRFNNVAYGYDSVQVANKGNIISHNTLMNIASGAAIQWANGPVQGVSMGNVCYNVTSGTCVQTTTGVTQVNNIIE